MINGARYEISVSIESFESVDDGQKFLRIEAQPIDAAVYPEPGVFSS